MNAYMVWVIIAASVAWACVCTFAGGLFGRWLAVGSRKGVCRVFGCAWRKGCPELGGPVIYCDRRGCGERRYWPKLPKPKARTTAPGTGTINVKPKRMRGWWYGEYSTPGARRTFKRAWRRAWRRLGRALSRDRGEP